MSYEYSAGAKLLSGVVLFHGKFATFCIKMLDKQQPIVYSVNVKLG